MVQQGFENYPRTHQQAEDFFFECHEGWRNTHYCFLDQPQRNWEASQLFGIRLRFINPEAAVDGATDGEPFDIKFCRAPFKSFSACIPGTMFQVGVTEFQRANCRKYVVVATEENAERNSYKTRFLYCTVP
jgi:hypothetical protein